MSDRLCELVSDHYMDDKDTAGLGYIVLIALADLADDDGCIRCVARHQATLIGLDVPMWVNMVERLVFRGYLKTIPPDDIRFGVQLGMLETAESVVPNDTNVQFLEDRLLGDDDDVF